MTIRRVAFAGEKGAFSEEAARALWPRATLVPVRTVADVTRAVQGGDVEAGILPVENSVAGGVTAAYDALSEAHDLHAIAELILDVRQCLLGIATARVEELTEIASHPVALAQCSTFLRRLTHASEIAASDTASAARDVARAGDRRRGAIASRHAAREYGLAILAENIEDRPDNQTRFLGIGWEPAHVAAGVDARTSLVFETPNEPGALLRVLEPLARHELNLSKLESRPTGEPWTYRFFADVDHVAGDAALGLVLEAIRSATRTCRVLGTYERHRRAHPVPQEQRVSDPALAAPR